MTTGQAPIAIRTGNALDQESSSVNVATNQADIAAERAANVDGKDIYPNSIVTGHLSAADAIIHGLIKSGAIIVGAGGVVVTSDENGTIPTNGLYLGAALLQLMRSGVATVTLDGNTGIITATDFQFTTGPDSSVGTGTTGARVEMNADGLIVYDSANAEKVFLSEAGVGICNASSGSPTVEERLSFYGAYGGTEDAYIFCDNTAKRLRMIDGRMAAHTYANVVSIPVIDYGIVAITTGIQRENGLAVAWSTTNHAAAPDIVLCTALNNENNGCKFLSIGVHTKSSTGAVLDWMTVDNSDQNSATDIMAVGIWF
jgi:hypothetical protein